MKHIILTLVVFAAAGGGLPAEEPTKPNVKPPSGETPSDEERKRRIDFMKEELSHFQIVPADNTEAALALTKEPLLHYTNPVRPAFSDGTLFLWLEGKRPLAAAVVSLRRSPNVVREFSSFTPRPLICRRDGKMLWSPRGGNLVDQPLADTAPPDASDKRRLRQMRDIARRFRALKKAGKDVELRLMTQPVYRYATAEAADAAEIDGAVFVFAEATDPDCLLVVEAHRGGPVALDEWRYTLARMTSTGLDVELDGRSVLSLNEYWSGPRSPEDPYVEMPFGSYPPPWKVESGKWKVESGKWKVESGKWKVESGEWKWKVESGKWKVESGKWKVESGVREAVKRR